MDLHRLTPAPTMTEQEARERVREMKAFYVNLAAYLVVITGLALLNLSVSPDFWWFLFPALGWGMGLMGHYTSAFGLPGLGREWERQKMQELMAQEALSLEEVKHLVDARLEERPATLSADEVGRLVRRVEHLEAIVTSRDWDALDADYRQPTPDAPDPTPTERAKEIAQRVR